MRKLLLIFSMALVLAFSVTADARGGHGGGGHSGGHGGNWGPHGVGLGFVGGAIVGGLVARSYYYPPPVYYAPNYYAPDYYPSVPAYYPPQPPIQYQQQYQPQQNAPRTLLYCDATRLYYYTGASCPGSWREVLQ